MSPANILNLPDYTVTRLEETTHDYHVYATVNEPSRRCHACQSPDVVGHGRNEQLIRDLPTHGKRVGIYVDVPRYRCRACGKTFGQRLPQVDDKRAMTARLVRWVGQESLRRTFAGIAEDTGTDEKTVRNIFRDHVRHLETTVCFETPRWLGIDEIHLLRPRCVVCNIEQQTAINLLPNRNKSSVITYLQQLPNRDRVQYVAMDMWHPYREAVATILPQATVIVDKFHVLRQANQALEVTRKATRASLTPKQRRALMRDRFVLLKRQRDLTDQETLLLSGWAENFPALKAAYELKESFFDIYLCQTRHEALLAYADWCQRIPPELEPAFRPLTGAINSWKDEIFAYFDHRITNAYTESLNNLIRVTNRLGRGYSFEVLRAKILFTEGIQKTRRPSFERQRGMEKGKATVAFMTTNRQQNPDPLRYGASLSTLARFLEEGKL
ncbi:MAG: ISL3 family transposase [Sulfuricaulis sp.]